MSWTVDHIFRPSLTAPPLIQFKPPTNHCSDRDFSFSRALSSRIQLFFGTGKKVFRNSRSRRFLGTDFVTSVSVLSAAPTPQKGRRTPKTRSHELDPILWLKFFSSGLKLVTTSVKKNPTVGFETKWERSSQQQKYYFWFPWDSWKGIYLKGHLSESSAKRSAGPFTYQT